MPEKCFYDVSKLSKQDVVEYPEFMAKFYDFIYSQIRNNDDVDYYLGLIEKSGGTVLEIGAGTGRVLTEALKKGADIYGVDTSPEMINVLRNKLSDDQQNRVFVKDARFMNLGIEFDLIIAPFRMFQHILATDEQLALLSNIYSHLKPGGRFVFDVFVPDPLIISKGIDNDVVFEGECEPGKILSLKTTSHSDFSKQISSVTMDVSWIEDSETRNMRWDMEIRYFYRYELENLIRLSEFRLVNIFGDFRKGEITQKSEDYVVVCEKDILRL